MPSTPPAGEPPEAANEPVAVPPGADAPTTEGPAAAAPPHSGPPPLGPPPGGYPPPPGYPPPSAGWAPVPRPPRVPWVNPDRRLHLVGAAVIAALVLLAGGFGIGYAASSGHDHHGDMRMDRGNFGDLRGPGMMRGGYPDMHGPRGQLPQFPNPQATSTAPTPTPTPTSTK
jgi:hypothetical protein